MLTSTSASLNGLAPPRSSCCLQHIWPAAGVCSTFDQQLVSAARLTSSWCLQHVWPAASEHAIGLSGYCVKMPSVTSDSLHLTQGLKGGGGCLVSLSCLESQGCHFISLSYLLFFSLYLILSLFLSCLVSAYGPFFWLFFFSFLFLQKIVQYILLRCRLFVCPLFSSEKMIVGRWFMQLAAIWNWY